MCSHFSKFARLLYRSPVGRSNQYGLGRTITSHLGNPPVQTHFVAPRGTPCTDPDHDQAKEARLRAVYQEEFHIEPKECQSPNWKRWGEVGEDSFQSFRDEYHHYHHPFRAGFSQDPAHQFRKSGLGVRQAIVQREQRRPFVQLLPRGDTTRLEQDPNMLELMARMIRLEEGLRASRANIIHMRNELMVLDCSLRYTCFKI